MALLHANGQLRTERDVHPEKGCQPAVQHKTTDDDAAVTNISKFMQFTLH